MLDFAKKKNVGKIADFGLQFPFNKDEDLLSCHLCISFPLPFLELYTLSFYMKLNITQYNFVLQGTQI